MYKTSVGISGQKKQNGLHSTIIMVPCLQFETVDSEEIFLSFNAAGTNHPL